MELKTFKIYENITESKTKVYYVEAETEREAKRMVEKGEVETEKCYEGDTLSSEVFTPKEIGFKDE